MLSFQHTTTRKARSCRIARRKSTYLRESGDAGRGADHVLDVLSKVDHEWTGQRDHFDEMLFF
jgi:hypothetical protein